MVKSVPANTGGSPHADIAKLRLAIDKIDEKILDLINRRLRLAKKIGSAKKQGRIRIPDKLREKEIMDRLLKKSQGPLRDDGLRHIFRAIIAEGRNVQKTDRKPK
jgi:chorismate mutase/prephenate dehydratase